MWTTQKRLRLLRCIPAAIVVLIAAVGAATAVADPELSPEPLPCNSIACLPGVSSDAVNGESFPDRDH